MVLSMSGDWQRGLCGLKSGNTVPLVSQGFGHNVPQCRVVFNE